MFYTKTRWECRRDGDAGKDKGEQLDLEQDHTSMGDLPADSQLHKWRRGGKWERQK